MVAGRNTLMILFIEHPKGEHIQLLPTLNHGFDPYEEMPDCCQTCNHLKSNPIHTTADRSHHERSGLHS